MSTVEFTFENKSIPATSVGDWNYESAYRCHLCICEEEGVFSAMVLNLPGVGSCGESEEEAIKNAREAIEGVIESYAESGDSVPWAEPNPDNIPHDAKQLWILVNVESS